jgi:hypothetical protein
MLAGGYAAVARRGLAAAAAPRTAGRMIGIQVGAVSFVDEGTEAVLDGLWEMASIDTLFVASFTYGRGIGGRMPRGNPLPDHGKQEYDDDYRGGNFATPHPALYGGTSIKPEKAPDHPGYDVLADVIPKAHARQMKVFAWFEDQIKADVPGLDEALEVDLDGARGTRVCYRNPSTRAFWLALAADFLQHYDLDGLMWGSERQGPLNAALQARVADDGRLASCCFCRFCEAAGAKQDIRAERAKAGFRAIERWLREQKAGSHPTDGSFVTFWRLLLEHPEVLAWERLWTEGLRDMYRDLYRRAHEIAPARPIGWHVWHQSSFSPFYRAEQDYAAFATCSDFLKVVLYNNCGGPRMARHANLLQSTLFGDLTPEETLALLYKVQQYPHEKDLDRLTREGLSADYVQRETQRAVAGVGGKVPIWPGIDIDIPTGDGEKKTTPEDVYAAVRAAFDGGAQGVLLSRKYSEMRLANLRAAGRAIREG